jgi:DNA-binding response OmpR family regulator
MARVLTADDSPTLRTLMQAVLTISGHDVQVAEDGDEALEILSTTPIDVLVLDVEMPNMDGYEVLRSIRKSGVSAGVRVLVLTGKQREADWLRAYRNGAHHYLPKPFEETDLMEAVDMLAAMSPEEATKHRQTELDRAELLARLEATLG